MLRYISSLPVYLFGLFFLYISFQYQQMNDLAVYYDTIINEGLYLGDAGFEFIQFIAIIFFGRDNAIFGLQVILFITFSSILFYKMESRPKFYEITVHLTSPILTIGLLNSIRQSIAFSFLLISYYNRKNFKFSIFFALIAVSIHKASIIALLLLVIGEIWQNFSKNSVSVKNRIKLLAVSSILSLSLIYILFPSVFERYSTYIFNDTLFTDGRFGEEKIFAWLSFWLFFITFSWLSFKKVTQWLWLGLAYTTIILIDSYARGFGEFQSRLILINFVIFHVVMLEICSYSKNKYIFLTTGIIFYLLNPSFLGVLL